MAETIFRSASYPQLYGKICGETILKKGLVLLGIATVLGWGLAFYVVYQSH